jgi:hypothetical protein
MHIVAAIGLVSYAFNWRILPAAVWFIFSIAYAIYSVLSLGYFSIAAANKIATGQTTILVSTGAIGVLLTLQFFSWLPIRRLSTQT